MLLDYHEQIFRKHNVYRTLTYTTPFNETEKYAYQRELPRFLLHLVFFQILDERATVVILFPEVLLKCREFRHLPDVLPVLLLWESHHLEYSIGNKCWFIISLIAKAQTAGRSP